MLDEPTIGSGFHFREKARQMSKFYVMSGDLTMVIDRQEPFDAVCDVFRQLSTMNPVPDLSMFTKVGESGSEEIEPDDYVFLTETILDTIGLKEDFQWTEDEDGGESTWQ